VLGSCAFLSELIGSRAPSTRVGFELEHDLTPSHTLTISRNRVSRLQNRAHHLSGSVERLTDQTALSRAALARFVRPGSRSPSQARREVCLITPPPLDTTPDVEAEICSGATASTGVCCSSYPSTTTRSDPGARLRRPTHNTATILGQCQRWRIIGQDSFSTTRACGQIQAHRILVCEKSSGG
jgi:hypothetical protein